MQVTESSKLFLRYCSQIKKLSSHSLRAYEIDLNSFDNFIGANRTIGSINRTDLQNYLQYLYYTCRLKQSTAKRRFACLKSLFQWLEHQEYIYETPFRKAKITIRLPGRLPKGLTIDEIKSILALLSEQVDYLNPTWPHENWIKNRKEKLRNFIALTAIQLLFATGMRVAELCTVKIDDINISNGVIKINGKGDRERLVFLTGSAMAKLLQRYIAIRKSYASNHDHLMITTRGNPANTQYIRLLIINSGKSACIKRRVTPHMLRHSTATHLLNNGMDIYFVQRLLGHQSITTTQIYAQVNSSKLQADIIAKHPLVNMGT